MPTPNTSATGGYLVPNPAPSAQPLEDDALTNFLQEIIVNLTSMDPTLVRPRWQVNPPNQPANNVSWVAIGVHRSEKDIFPAVQHRSSFAGYLLGGPLDDGDKDPMQWTGITDASLAITVNGDAPVNVTSLDFSTATQMVDVARIISNQLVAQRLGCLCSWTGIQFLIVSQSAGHASAVAPLTGAGVGTDISAKMYCTQALMLESASGEVVDDILNRNQQLDVLCSFYGPQADSLAALVSDGLAIAQNREAMGSAGFKLVEVGEAIALPVKINNLWYYRVDQMIIMRRYIVRSYPILDLQSAGGVIQSSDVTIHFSA